MYSVSVQLMGRAQEWGDLTVPSVELLSPLASSGVVKNPMSCHLLQAPWFSAAFLFPAQPPLAL